MNHRSIFTWVAALGALLVGLAPTVPTTSALPVGQGIIDVTVDIESKPEVVAPAGGGVLYRITASDASIPVNLSSQGTVTGTLPGDFVVLDDGECTTSPGTGVISYSCAVSSFPKTFDILMQTASTPATYTRTATAQVALAGPAALLEFESNNTDAAVTSVQPLTNELGVTAFVCGGCELEFSDPDVGTAVLTVPEQQLSDPSDPSSPMEDVPGLIVRLNQNDDFTGQQCEPGGGTCESALEVWFDESEATYQVNDPRHPVVVSYVPKQGPCFGVGNSNCAPLAYFDPNKAGMTSPAPLPTCDSSGVALVGGTYNVCDGGVFKVGNKIGRHVNMKSKDPLIPPLNIGG